MKTNRHSSLSSAAAVLGHAGGPARAAKLSPARRAAIAAQGGRAAAKELSAAQKSARARKGAVAKRAK